ncbi:spliceosome-associated protein CWC27 homolog isoform X2 [Rhinatrema bivittatum]|uniref:spliceosome-associated protein CWC27 homolog isoform X2 n=1 Tax=Rhinatrema bivittatum TaxID=194408 RepID=UPI001127D040|nr:spliceosome-associated protein CWC27 homolog isoform X2 [Rhinatrema bivittatum]
MSNIYIQEPPTNGKILLKTTAGDIDIELWSKEAPKASRNFIQLCMEGYYDDTVFHRVVPGFIVQGGDPTGTGLGGSSIYGQPFKDEFHSRLQFKRRGLVAMANAGPHDNGSQFFFTLGPADELNNKHTIFGKVTGDTVYNMLRLTEVEVDADERAVNPHKIKCCEVLFNPFDDIIPRVIKKLKEKKEEDVKKTKSKGTKNFNLLSFGEEAEEEEVEVMKASQSMKGKSKSSHDLLKDDPRLSSVPAIESKKVKNEKWQSDEEDEDDSDDEGEHEENESDREEKNQMKERIAKKLKKDDNKTVKPPSKQEEKESAKKMTRSEELRKEVRQLKRELIAAKHKKEENDTIQTEKRNEEEETTNIVVAEYLKEKQKYEERRKQAPKKGASREHQTLALLDQFKSKLTQAISETPEEVFSESEVEDDTGCVIRLLWNARPEK